MCAIMAVFERRPFIIAEERVVGRFWETAGRRTGLGQH